MSKWRIVRRKNHGIISAKAFPYRFVIQRRWLWIWWNVDWFLSLESALTKVDELTEKPCVVWELRP